MATVMRAQVLWVYGMAFCVMQASVGCSPARTCNGRAIEEPVAEHAVELGADAAKPKRAAQASHASASDVLMPAYAGRATQEAHLDSSKPAAITVTGSQLTLLRTALGQPFLLSPALVLASNTPIIDHGQPLIVQFEQAEDRLALFAQNHAAVYQGLATRRLLQTFSIVSEDEDTITFRWHFGLQSIDQRMAMAYSDWPASLDAYVEAESAVLPVDDAYLADVSVRGDALVLHQVARVRRTVTPMDLWGILQGGFESYPLEATVNAYFTLAPMHTSPSFVPKLSTRQRDVGYFEVATMRAGDGGLDAWATRWDSAEALGPVRYLVTDDVPDDLVDAVSEGILYWNRVAGRPLVEVQTGVARDAMPDARQVIVHWIDWRQAGFARADLQPHPLTGEILRADIYLTSSFADVSAERVVDALVPQMPSQAQAPWQKAFGHRLVPQGFSGAPQCAYASAASAVVRSSLDQRRLGASRIRQAVADNIRLVVAHEVGHTLGLRHNFGASNQSAVPDQTTHDDLWRDYLDDAGHQGAATATSVMDYMGGSDGFLLGAYIRTHALPYDDAALSWGYGPQKSAHSTTPSTKGMPLLFCTDIERAGDLVGCAAHDSGRNPLAGQLAQAIAAREAMPRWILNQFIDGLHPQYLGDKKTVQQIVEHFDFDKHALAVAYWGQQTFSALQEYTQVLSVQRSLGHLRVLDDKAYKAATHAQLSAWLDEIGGLPGIVTTLLHYEAADPNHDDSQAGLDVGWLEDAVVAQIKAPGFSTGYTAQGRAYALSASEYLAIRNVAPKVAAHLEQSILRDVMAAVTGGIPGSRNPETQPWWSVWLQALAATAHLQSDLVRPDWQDALGDLASLVLMHEDGVTEGLRQEKPVSVGNPGFREDVRLAAVRLLSPVVFGTPSWLESLRGELQKRLRERLLRVANAESGPLGLRLAGLYTGPDFVIPVDVSPELRRWAETEMRVLEALRKVQNASVLRGVADEL